MPCQLLTSANVSHPYQAAPAYCSHHVHPCSQSLAPKHLVGSLAHVNLQAWTTEMVASRNETSNKSLFKRKRGLSKFYANKSQSFSTLDHALMTCLGHSALALERPRQRSVEPTPKSDVDMEVKTRPRRFARQQPVEMH